jgi:hypothetical protein
VRQRNEKRVDHRCPSSAESLVVVIAADRIGMSKDSEWREQYRPAHIFPLELPQALQSFQFFRDIWRHERRIEGEPDLVDSPAGNRNEP